MEKRDDLGPLALRTANRYHIQPTERLRYIFHALTGHHLLDPTLSPKTLFHAPFYRPIARHRNPPTH